jgi:rSAM/selenodomain-associated transferase 2
MSPTGLSSRDVAIVVPTLDESAAVARFLPAALAQCSEVIVSDGGSRDDTTRRAAALGARVITGEPGRGGQLNRGAAAAGRPILLFLHADTLLPEDGVAQVAAAIESGALGGAFCIAFDRDGPLYRFGARMVNRRTRRFHLPLGDQGQFAHRAVFEALGGFRSWPILEDLDFARRLARHAGRRFAVIERPVLTSARRFVERGPVRTVATNWLIWALFFAGVSPHRLARLYRHIR